MPEPRIADDFAYIAGRLRDLEGEKPQPATKWGVWYVPKKIWCVMRAGQTTYKADTATSGRPTLFDSEAEAKTSIAASADPAEVRQELTAKPYLETLT